MTQKKYNDPVIYTHNVKENGVLASKDSNALVIASMIQDGKETLQLLYLDAAFDRPILSGADVQSAIKVVYASPYVDNAFRGDAPIPGKPTFAPVSPAQGWKDAEVLSEDQLSQIQANSADAQAKDDAQWEKQLEEATIEAANLRLTITTLNEQKAELLKQLAETRTVRFGLGEVVCTPGKSNDFPAVILEPASPKGEVGADASGNAPQDVVLPGAVVLEFHGADGAQVLIQDVAGLFPPAPETPKEQ